MNKSKRPFQGYFQDPLEGKKRVDEIVSKMISHNELKPLLNYLNNHKELSLLKINYSQLSIVMKPILKNLIDDLEDCISYVHLASVSPTALKKDLTSLQNHIKGIHRIIEDNPVLAIMMDSIFAEGMFNQKYNFYLLHSNEVRELINLTPPPESTIQNLKQTSSKLDENINSLLKMIPTKEDTSIFIGATRMKCFPDIDKKRLLFYTFDVKNRLLYIVTYHLEKLANELGINSTSGVAGFAYEGSKPIGNHLANYFSTLGSIHNIDTETILELFRSEAWLKRKYNEGYNFTYLGKNHFSNILKSK